MKILFSGHTEDYSPGDGLLDSFEGLFKEVREEPGYVGVFAEKKKKVYMNIERLLLITKTDILMI